MKNKKSGKQVPIFTAPSSSQCPAHSSGGIESVPQIAPCRPRTGTSGRSFLCQIVKIFENILAVRKTGIVLHNSSGCRFVDGQFTSVSVGGASITQSGIRAGGQQITNVVAGEVSATSTDAVNGNQLYQIQQGINQNSAGIGNLVNRVNDLDDQIDKVGAVVGSLGRTSSG